MWCTALPEPERFQASLLPIVLGGTNDNAPEVQLHAAKVMTASFSDVDINEEKDGGRAETEKTDLVNLPEPFDKQPPSAGAKRIVKRLLQAMLPNVLKELGEWTVSRRQQAAGMLGAMLVYGESEFTSHLPKLLRALGSGCRDEEDAVAQKSFFCAELVGQFVSCDAVLSVLLPLIASKPTSSDGAAEDASAGNKPITDEERTGYLMILSAIFGAIPEEDALPQVKSVMETLSKPVVCESDSKTVQAQLVEVLVDMIDACGEHCGFDKDEELNFLMTRVLLQLQASRESQDVRDSATAAMQSLADASGVSPTTIFAHHFDSLLDVVIGPAPRPYATAASWTSDSPQRTLFDVLMRQGGEAVGAHLGQVLPIFEIALKPARDPDLRMCMLALLDTIFSDPVLSEYLLPLGGPMLQKLILPNAVWRVGRVACTVRRIAMRAMRTLLAGRLVDNDSTLALVAELLPVMKSCLDDDEPLTRSLTCDVLTFVFAAIRGSLDAELARDIYPELLKRLDDSNDQVRVSVCSLFQAFFHAPAPGALAGTPFGYTVETLFVHLDDPDIEMQRAVFAALSTATEVDKGVVLRQAKKALTQHRDPQFVKDLISRCEEEEEEEEE